MLHCYPMWHWGSAGKDWQAGALWSLMGLTIASKGGLNAVVWHLTAHRYIKAERGLHSPGGGPRERKAIGAWDMPEALREEWLSYTQLGIRLAVEAAEEAAGTPREHSAQRIVMLPSIRPDTDSPRISSTRTVPRTDGAGGFGAVHLSIGSALDEQRLSASGQQLLPRVAGAPTLRAPPDIDCVGCIDASMLEERGHGRPWRWLFSRLTASVCSFFSSSA